MSRILIKYASRQRPELFNQTIANIQETISHKLPFEILVSMDRDDIAMMNAQLPIENYIGYAIGEAKSKIDAINRDIALADPWDILINMSDDMKFIVKDWDLQMVSMIKEVWKESTDFFAHFNDGYVEDKLPTMSIIGRAYYHRTGYIYHPAYKSFSCDAEAYYVAKMLGKWHYFPQVLFKHEHPANNKQIQNDELYHRNSLHTPDDIKVYWQRLNNYFDIQESERVCIPFAEHLGRTI